MQISLLVASQNNVKQMEHDKAICRQCCILCRHWLQPDTTSSLKGCADYQSLVMIYVNRMKRFWVILITVMGGE